MNDQQREQLLALLETPRTLKELCEETGGNKHTMYRAIRDLQAEQVVVEQPWRKNKQSVYVKTTAPIRGQIMFKVPGAGPQPVGAFTGISSVDLNKRMRGVFSYLWRRAYFAPKPGQLENFQQSPGGVEVIKAKQEMRELREALKQMLAVVDQALISDIWTEGDSNLLDKFGPVGEIVHVVTAAEEWESDYIHRHGVKIAGKSYKVEGT